jgi:hypothetical protein
LSQVISNINLLPSKNYKLFKNWRMQSKII